MKNIAYLGPRGTFTEAALLQLNSAKDANLLPYPTVTAVLGATTCVAGAVPDVAPAIV